MTASPLPNPTTAKYNGQDSRDVISYRMGILESEVKGINSKLDSFISLYPSNEVLKLILDPMRDDIKECKDTLQTEAQNKVKSQQQLKFMALAAILGPIGTFIITVILANILGVVPK